MSQCEAGDSFTEDNVLTKSKLLAAAGEFDLESIQILDIQNSKIDDLTLVANCASLTRLNARKNEITILKPLKNLKMLTWLNLAGNRITNIDPLIGLESLVDLNLAGNLLGSFERIHCLASIETLKKLRFLDTVEKLSNPICHNLTYEQKILQMFPNLTTLDGLKIRGKGSELFKICRELDDQIKNGRTFGPVEEKAIPGAWFKPGYFSLPSSTSEDFATKEFREILSECKKLNQSASDHIMSMKTE